jgi:hypothetical protein
MRTPYACPVCAGRGAVPVGFYEGGSSAGIGLYGTVACKACNGAGIVWDPMVTPPLTPPLFPVNPPEEPFNPWVPPRYGPNVYPLPGEPFGTAHDPSAYRAVNVGWTSP